MAPCARGVCFFCSDQIPSECGVFAIDLDQLQRAVAMAEPSAVLVPARILRRVIKKSGRGGVARQTFFAISGKALAAIVEGSELNHRAAAPWPESVLLLEAPDPDDLDGSSPGALLTTAWRRLFRARLMAEIRRALDSGAIDEPGLRSRIEAIGSTAFDEARAVLRQDGWIAPGASDAEVFVAFVAIFLELSQFAPGLRIHTFPAIEDPAAVERLLAADLDAPALFGKTRPTGAPDPDDPASGLAETPEPDSDPDSHDHDHDHDGEPDHSLREQGRARSKTRRLAKRAHAASERGNTVRAAILWAGSAHTAALDESDDYRASARAALKHLADRLTRALFVRKGESETWADALTPLLRRASRGFWSPEARMLYDLQKVCIDHERAIFRIDVLDWAWSRGRRPLKRPLPHLRVVAMSNHLRRAVGRLPKARLSREERGRLEGLFRDAVHRVEHDVREQFRPTIEATLAATWVKPSNLPERVALVKLVEELLDRIVGRGFSTLGDLRDFASQGDLKLPDLNGPGEFFRGDRLLKTDRALAEQLDGVHRHGEVYLRWLQRLSSLAFGTRPGRAFTLFVALPYGGAAVLLKGLEEIDHLIVSRVVAWLTHREMVTHDFVNAWSVILIGSVALGAINFARFRSHLMGTFRLFGQTLRAILVDLPAWILNNPFLLRVLGSAVVLAIWTVVLKPIFVAGPVWGLARLVGSGPLAASVLGALAFITACLVFNSRAGRALEEVVVEKIVRAVRALVFDVLPGLFQLVMTEFARVLEWVERVIYAVDEWLRFRKGQSTAVLGLKAALGLVWGVVAYLVRIYVNLLIEPQVNPIKHFPVVTVSHKVILPLSFKITRVMEAVLIPFLGRELGALVAWANVFLLPGVFGFLVWELKSNWRLYEANRPESLGPLVVGSHGETVVQLLRPGFHSGTLPKLFGRLRRARRGGREGAALKRREALHHVEESIRRLVERELSALLRQTRTLGGLAIEPGSIHLATNRIRIELLAGAPDDSPGLWIDLEERDGVLAASLSRPGWLQRLDADERRVLDDALAGLYKFSGVERAAATLDFRAVVIRWADWVACWEQEAKETPGQGNWPQVLPAPGSQPAPISSG